MAVTHEPMWTLGNRLWRAREFAELDQETLARRLGVSRATVSKWERDKSQPTVSQAQTWARETTVSFAWLTDIAADLDPADLIPATLPTDTRSGSSVPDLRVLAGVGA